MARMVHFSASWERLWSKQAQRLGESDFMAVTHFFWRNKAHFISRAKGLEALPAVLSTIIAEKSIADIVLYGDTRPIHAEATKLAKALDLRVHVFEKGYLRPLAKIQGSFASQAHLWR
jgi:capsule polysaccharide modification protein KpsS